MGKKYDLCVKVGSYKDKQGKDKGRYENVGAAMEGNDGPYLILKRTFNPSGVPNPDDRDTVIISCFEVSVPMPDKIKQEIKNIQAPFPNDDIPF